MKTIEFGLIMVHSQEFKAHIYLEFFSEILPTTQVLRL